MTTLKRAEGPFCPAVLVSPSAQPDTMRWSTLTRVALAHVEQRTNVYLRFGVPVRELRLDRWRRSALFAPGMRFCRVIWEANDYGTTRWQLMVLQACAQRTVMQHIVGIRPGALLLLCAEGERQVKKVLQRIDAVEALGIDPSDVAPTYWHTLQNRLAARGSLPLYSVERHVAWLRKEILR